MEDKLNKIKDFADKAHGDQMRRYSKERYIVHPERVMKLLMSYTKELPVLAAALLHDVLEDTPVKKEEIQEFLESVMSEEEALRTVELVVELTDVYTKENEPRLNRKKRKAMEAERLGMTSAAAQTIKYADLIDNSIDIAHNDPDFARVFLRENKGLLEKMKNGNQELYDKAVKTVYDCEKTLNREE